MQQANVLACTVPEDRFAHIRPEDLSEAELSSLTALALEALARLHRPGELLTSPEGTRAYLQLSLADRPFEVFGVILLDNRHRVICNAELFHGTIDGACVYPRVIARRVLESNAAAVIIYHNHPAGLPTPSQADRKITRTIVEALKLLDVRVLDHVVVGGEGSVSFAEQGLL